MCSGVSAFALLLANYTFDVFESFKRSILCCGFFGENQENLQLSGFPPPFHHLLAVMLRGSDAEVSPRLYTGPL